MQAPVSYSQLLMGAAESHAFTQQQMSPNFIPLDPTNAMLYGPDEDKGLMGYGSFKQNILRTDECCYNILIHGLCMMGSIEEALDFTNDMEKYGLGPDHVTFNIITKGFRLLGMMDDAGKVTNRMLRRGLDIDRHIYNTVEERFSLCNNGRMDEALRFLSEMENASLIPDHVMYSIIINGLCKMGEVQKAVQLYKEMCLKKITTDYVQNRSTLLRLCEKGGVSEVRSYFDKVANSNLVEDIVLYNIMINKYAKLGNIGEAIRLCEIGPNIIVIIKDFESLFIILKRELAQNIRYESW
ncbi:Hypothetical predicted protein [Olea europaea subsp. europaea]|uniref:Pentatricopeptide repeat-containing protein n=1 Tax=Olea europaea subsp. europaea TaxID=158383 RepID=A0A8S0QL24_OLEEU|nr:Hypothetical predicted protein [Olea europaea subsp. europaea]